LQINLARRNLGKNEAHLLGSVIRGNPHLSVLKLGYNDLGNEGTSILAAAIQRQEGGHHPSLSTIDLGFNGIGNAGGEALAVHVLAGNYQIRTLYLSGNSVGPSGAIAIAGAVLHGTGLSCLHLYANPIGTIGIRSITTAIARKEEAFREAVRPICLGGIHVIAEEDHVGLVRELHVGATDMGPDGLATIPAMLLGNFSIQTVDLSQLGIDDNFMMLLSHALGQNRALPLKRVLLGFNDISCIGVEYFMNAVWGSTTLREIKLDNNRLQDRGAQLCAVVLSSIALEHLDLSMNQISSAGIKALMKSLSENASMKVLAMSGIPMDQNASKAISYALAYNTSLESLYLDNSTTGYSTQRHIVAGIVSNRRSSLRVVTGFTLARKFPLYSSLFCCTLGLTPFVLCA
jgi:Ran GTPase-activating protein (RanGAP) involved in mRNA processing and transport